LSTPTTFDEFIEQGASEKIGLATVDAGRELKGWEVHAANVHKFTGFDESVVIDTSDDGVSLTEVFDLASIGTGDFFNDRVNKILYLELSDSSDPNDSFVSVIFRLFFATAPVSIAHDLGNGFEVPWLPLLR